MKETTIKTVPVKIEMQAWADKAAAVLRERAANPRDLDDALLAVYLENAGARFSGQILLAVLGSELLDALRQESGPTR